MKQLTELKDGQKVLLALTVTEQNDYPAPYRLIDENKESVKALYRDLKNYTKDSLPQEIYDFDEVMNAKKSEPISKEEFDDKLYRIDSQYHENNITYKDYKDKLYNLFQSYHPESFTPEIGKEYGFYDEDINHLIIGKFRGYRCNHGMGMKGVETYKNIIEKPIQQSEEELKAIELLKSLGYEVNKK